jgi:EAL domain-containing protein (putative c-di-GMP-specific phosphodiesterase class I)
MADRLRTVEELREGLTRDELVIHLQRQVRPDTGAVVGLEALVRWQHPTRGLLSPAELLPAAEQAGLLGPLTEAVIELALAAAARWWPFCTVPVAVNLSAANLTDPLLHEKVARALERHAVPPEALVLEVVEDTLMVDPVGASDLLRRLRESGVGISIDDYGTGYSSLAYLKDLPADELKIDRAFTADLTVDARSQAIVEHTVSLAHVLGLRVVAEGVEDQASLDLLTDLGCDAVQGYHVARPAPVEQVLAELFVLCAPPLVPQQARGGSGDLEPVSVSAGCCSVEPVTRQGPAQARA